MGNNFSREAETERAYQRLKQAYDDQLANEIALRTINIEQEEALKFAAQKRSLPYEGLSLACILGEYAEQLLEENSKRFEVVGGTITVGDVDERAAFNERLRNESL
ncbi:unnamed protein product [Enterobius vermicularis]|uniref:Terminase small subunit n=1 Tax=Enterobius vermicularis TaxID=51028 RepID=A0A0N4UY66_ENTVE|nr:unnamed protein product [Enterobius vermicularis]